MRRWGRGERGSFDGERGGAKAARTIIGIRPVARGGSGGSNEPPLRGKRSNYVEVR